MESRPKRKSFNIPGHAHELTFSTFHKAPIFARDTYCETFLSCLDDTRRQLLWEVWAYVVMPDHVHVLALPLKKEYKVAEFLQRLKHPASMRISSQMKHDSDPLLKQLATKNGGVRVWQLGGGYDRNIHSNEAARSSIDYIHNNPVSAKLVTLPWLYKWSSASWYQDRTGPFEVDLFRA